MYLTKYLEPYKVPVIWKEAKTQFKENPIQVLVPLLCVFLGAFTDLWMVLLAGWMMSFIVWSQFESSNRFPLGWVTLAMIIGSVVFYRMTGRIGTDFMKLSYVTAPLVVIHVLTELVADFKKESRKVLRGLFLWSPLFGVLLFDGAVDLGMGITFECRVGLLVFALQFALMRFEQHASTYRVPLALTGVVTLTWWNRMPDMDFHYPRTWICLGLFLVIGRMVGGLYGHYLTKTEDRPYLLANDISELLRKMERYSNTLGEVVLVDRGFMWGNTTTDQHQTAPSGVIEHFADYKVTRGSDRDSFIIHFPHGEIEMKWPSVIRNARQLRSALAQGGAIDPVFERDDPRQVHHYF